MMKQVVDLAALATQLGVDPVNLMEKADQYMKKQKKDQLMGEIKS